MYCKEAWMDMQNRIPSLRDMDMAYQLDRMKPQGKMTFKEKEMEPKFKVGDKVVTPKGKWGEVIAVGLFVTVKLRESRLSTGTFNLTTHTTNCGSIANCASSTSTTRQVNGGVCLAL